MFWAESRQVSVFEFDNNVWERQGQKHKTHNLSLTHTAGQIGGGQSKGTPGLQFPHFYLLQVQWTQTSYYINT